MITLDPRLHSLQCLSWRAGEQEETAQTAGETTGEEIKLGGLFKDDQMKAAGLFPLGRM